MGREKPEKDGRSCWWLMMFVVTPLALLFVLHSFSRELENYFGYYRFPDEMTTPPTGYKLVGVVPRIKWGAWSKPGASDEQIAQDIAQRRLPVVLSNTPCDHWTACHRWSHRYLGHQVKDRVKAQWQTYHPDFVYWDSEKPMHQIGGIGLNHIQQTKTVDSTVKQFFKATQKHDENYYYLSERIGPKRKNGFSQVAKDVEPREFMMIDEELSRPTRHASTVWLGGDNVVTTAHYDSAHNFNFQIYGEKRFIIAPPTEYEHLYIHPQAHPASKQSQVNFSSPDMDLFPSFGSAEAFTAVLREGDLLYLPPFWFHRVVALTLSMSVNVWSDSLEGDIIDKAINAGYPKELEKVKGAKFQQSGHQISFLSIFLRAVIRAVLKTSDAEDFIQNDILLNRFRPLYMHLSCGESEFKDGVRCPWQINIPRAIELQEEVKETAQKIANIFDELDQVEPKSHAPFQNGNFMGSVKRIVLANYVERMTNMVVGVEDCCIFLRCLQRKDSFEIVSEDASK